MFQRLGLLQRQQSWCNHSRKGHQLIEEDSASAKTNQFPIICTNQMDLIPKDQGLNSCQILRWVRFSWRVLRNQVQVAIFVAPLSADDACLGAAPSLWRSDRCNILIHQLESRNCRDCKDQGIVGHEYQQFFHFRKSICGLSSPHKEPERAHNPRLQACMQIWVHVRTLGATIAK